MTTVTSSIEGFQPNFTFMGNTSVAATFSKEVNDINGNLKLSFMTRINGDYASSITLQGASIQTVELLVDMLEDLRRKMEKAGF